MVKGFQLSNCHHLENPFLQTGYKVGGSSIIVSPQKENEKLWGDERVVEWEVKRKENSRLFF